MQTNKHDLEPNNHADGEYDSALLFSGDIQSSTGKPPDWSAENPADTKTSIRVQVSLLDSLMTLAGELVLSRNQLLQTISTNHLKCAESVGQRIDLITSELQEAIMFTRMQPIGNVFNRFPAIVREVAARLDKQVELSINGQEVELDKTIIESIGDPLARLVRHAVAREIETPEERQDKGKTAFGTVVLRAFHEAGQVVIEIENDGTGLDGEQLAAQAVRAGLINTELAQSLSDKEKLHLLFLPGLNPTEAGSGMDEIRASFDKLGGQIDVSTKLGQGTMVSIKLPLTLAIIPCQVVMTEGERYAIPQVNLDELLRIPAYQVKERIEMVGSAEVVRLRGKLLPLVRLADVLGIDRTYTDPTDGTVHPDRRRRIADRRSRHSEAGEVVSAATTGTQQDHPARRAQDRRSAPENALNIVVVSAGTISYGLIVDRLQDSEEIVIKPLGRHLQHCQGYAGATIMGDGRIALILDVANLAHLAQLKSVDGSDRAAQLQKETEISRAVALESQSVLIFRSSEQEQFCIQLDRVERIEKIKRSDIEFLGHKRVMQYRGSSLHLLCVDDVAQVQPLANRDDLLVIVFSFGTHTIGLLACGPIDTREINSQTDRSTLCQPGIAGSTIIGSQTTMLIDIDEMVQAQYPEWI